MQVDLSLHWGQMREGTFSNVEADMIIVVRKFFQGNVHTVEPQWLEHLWDHGNLFETWVVQATEG